jgi:hypothetical protein
MGRALFTIVALLALTAMADELNEIVWLRFRGVERDLESSFARFVLCIQRTGSTGKRSAD